jgi:hypothetical protein
LEPPSLKAAAVVQAAEPAEQAVVLRAPEQALAAVQERAEPAVRQEAARLAAVV